MSVVQSSYSANIADAVAGFPADADFSAESRLCETSAGIGFGLVVGQGSDPKGGVLGAAAASGFVGIAIRDRSLVISSGQTVDKYQEGDVIAVMYRGVIWVPVAAAVVAGNNVTFNTSTGALSTIAADGSNFTIAGARWVDTQSTVNGLARVRLGGGFTGS